MFLLIKWRNRQQTWKLNFQYKNNIQCILKSLTKMYPKWEETFHGNEYVNMRKYWSLISISLIIRKNCKLKSKCNTSYSYMNNNIKELHYQSPAVSTHHSYFVFEKVKHYSQFGNFIWKYTVTTWNRNYTPEHLSQRNGGLCYPNICKWVFVIALFITVKLQEIIYLTNKLVHS